MENNINQNNLLSEKFLYDVINTVADPIFIKDVNSKFIFSNDAFCKILGMKPEDIIGKTLGESLPKEQMDLFLKNDRMVLESGNENISEEPLTGADGKILTIVTKKTRYIDEKDNKYLIGVIRDITEKKNFENMELLNNAMAGREIKMIELKSEIERLKEQLKEKNEKV